MKTVTALLHDWRRGDQQAADALLPLVYDELHKLAAHYMRGEAGARTFRPTELVSEAYLRLTEGAQPEWESRVHFYGIAARAMRQILVDHARKRGAGKRNHGAAAVALDDTIAAVERPADLLALDDALEALARFDARKARAVELCYFGGLTHEEISAALEVSVSTVARDLKVAESWIHGQMVGR